MHARTHARTQHGAPIDARSRPPRVAKQVLTLVRNILLKSQKLTGDQVDASQVQVRLKSSALQFPARADTAAQPSRFSRSAASSARAH